MRTDLNISLSLLTEEKRDEDICEYAGRTTIKETTEYTSIHFIPIHLFWQ